jgi:hypothetical protein
MSTDEVIAAQFRIWRLHLSNGWKPTITEGLRPLFPFPCHFVDDTILVTNPAGLCRKTRTLRRVFLFLDSEVVHEVHQAGTYTRAAN